MHSCAVIGCGPAGIAASTHLRQAGLLVTCFELSGSPGGMWHIDSSKNFSDRGLLSPLYPSMRCVLPKDVMAFSDQRFDYTVPQFPHHSSVKNYLERYASAKGVAALTRFNTKVQSARYDIRDNMWKLLTVNILSGDVLEWSFDKLCVCTGQTQEPRFPKDFKQVMKPYVTAGGEVEHACYIKDFRSLRRKRIVVLGNGITAADYCTGLHEIGAEVYQSIPPASAWTSSYFHSHKNGSSRGMSSSPSPSPSSSSSSSSAVGLLLRQGKKRQSVMEGWTRSAFQHITERRVHHPHVKRIGPLTGCDGKGLVFESSETDSSELLIDNVDMVICATGYTQRYPFLHADIRRVVEEEEVPLLMSHSRTTTNPEKGGEVDVHPHTNDKEAKEKTRSATAPEDQQSEVQHHSASSSTAMAPTRGLYLGTILRSNPSLAFIGVQKELLPPFLLYESQSRYVSYAFTQRIPLPQTEAEMMERERALQAEYDMTLPNTEEVSALGGQLNSSHYFNVLQQELGVGARENYTSRIAQRRRWLLTTTMLRVYHKFRSWAPLKRKKQHLLFSNKV